jgi:membrane protein
LINAQAPVLSKMADERGMGGRRKMKSGVIGLGERSLRNFFFEHPMATYAAALAYRGLFGLFPFLFILVVLLGALGISDFIDRAMDQARAQSSRYVPQQLEPVVEPAQEQVQPLLAMIERAEKQAGGDLLFFGVAVALWSVSAVARTLTEAFNVAYQVPETRRWWKQLLLSLAFGPILALVVIVSVALMLIGPQLVGSIAEVVNLDEVFVRLWGWLRFPVALLLLAVVLSVVYHFGPNARQRYRSVVPGAALSVVLWAISSVGFSIYLANFADYGVTYGSIGAAVGLLFYLYLCASVVLLGAELNAALYHSPTADTLEQEDENSKERYRGGHRHEQRRTIPAEVEHVRRQLASPGATRPRRPAVRACGSLLARSRLRRAGPPVRHLRGGRRGDNVRTRPQILGPGRAKVATVVRRGGGCLRRIDSPPLVRDDSKRVGLRHRGVGGGNRYAQDTHRDTATCRGGKWMAFGRKRCPVGALWHTPYGPGRVRCAISSAVYRCLRCCGWPGLDRIRLPSPGPEGIICGESLLSLSLGGSTGQRVLLALQGGEIP